MTKFELENKYSIVIQIMPYNSLIHAIPLPWKKLLTVEKGLNHTYAVYIDCKVMIDEWPKWINEINTKDIYWCIIQLKSMRPTSENKWGEKNELELTDGDWSTTLKGLLSHPSIAIQSQLYVNSVNIYLYIYVKCKWQCKKMNMHEFCTILFGNTKIQQKNTKTLMAAYLFSNDRWYQQLTQCESP